LNTHIRFTDSDDEEEEAPPARKKGAKTPPKKGAPRASSPQKDKKKAPKKPKRKASSSSDEKEDQVPDDEEDAEAEAKDEEEEAEAPPQYEIEEPDEEEDASQYEIEDEEDEEDDDDEEDTSRNAIARRFRALMAEKGQGKTQRDNEEEAPQRSEKNRHQYDDEDDNEDEEEEEEEEPEPPKKNKRLPKPKLMPNGNKKADTTTTTTTKDTGGEVLDRLRTQINGRLGDLDASHTELLHCVFGQNAQIDRLVERSEDFTTVCTTRLIDIQTSLSAMAHAISELQTHLDAHDKHVRKTTKEILVSQKENHAALLAQQRLIRQAEPYHDASSSSNVADVAVDSIRSAGENFARVADAFATGAVAQARTLLKPKLPANKKPNAGVSMLAAARMLAARGRSPSKAAGRASASPPAARSKSPPKKKHNSDQNLGPQHTEVEEHP
jgi:hypothetical protein